MEGVEISGNWKAVKNMCRNWPKGQEVWERNLVEDYCSFLLRLFTVYCFCVFVAILVFGSSLDVYYSVKCDVADEWWIELEWRAL